MADVDLASINLNLLVALDALLREVHVTRAAKRAGVSQSAMSHQLAALRDLFGDALLVRGPEGMELTQRAADLREPLHVALSRVRDVFRPPAEFAPETASGRFCIGSSDSLAAFLLPELLAKLSRLAPQLELSLIECNPRDFYRVLGSNDVQLTVGAMVSMSGLEQTLLFEEPFVCALREGHPAAKESLDLARFAELDHVLISPTGIGPSFVDDALAEYGLMRRVALRTTSFLLAPLIVARTNLVVTAPRHCLIDLAPRLGLCLKRAPVELPTLRIAMGWHERHVQDPLHTWMRTQLSAVATALNTALLETVPDPQEH